MKYIYRNERFETIAVLQSSFSFAFSKKDAFMTSIIIIFYSQIGNNNKIHHLKGPVYD